MRNLISNEVYKNLPDTLKSVTNQFTGRERDIVLLSSIGVLSNCLPNLYGNYNGSILYPHLYTMIVAPPASGKGVMNYSRLLVDDIHGFVKSETTNAKKDCEAKNKEIDDNATSFAQKSECPEIQLKIIGANISSIELYRHLFNSETGLLMIESEADTLSNQLKIDWGNFSDLLRKAFHHEPITVSRKTNNVHYEIPEPKLSIVVSGTPDQLQPLMKSRENGLFSRFIVYSFDEIVEFKNVFEPKKDDLKNLFKKEGKQMLRVFTKLASQKQPVRFKFTKSQSERFLKEFQKLHKEIIDYHSLGAISNLTRMAVIMFRIAMILSTLRSIDKIPLSSEITCTNRDFLISLNLTKTLIEHVLYTYDSIPDGKLSTLDEAILDSLNERFTRSEAIDIGEDLGVPERTMDDKIRKWWNRNIILKEKRGIYVKRK